MSKETRLVRKSKKRKLRKKVVFILVPLIVVFLAVATWGTMIYIKAGSALNGSYEDNGREKSDLRNAQVDPNVDDVSVLIMGVDASDERGNKDEGGLTDSLMLATLNKEDHNVKLLSIPRDSYVNIPLGSDESEESANPEAPEYKSAKINEAYAHGGTENTIDTVESLFDIPVDYYVKVNFDAFIDVVDALDGVDVDVPYELNEQDSEDHADAIHLQPGKQKLDGEEALALARTRKQDNDIERGKRQQEIIKAVLDRTVSLNSVLKYDDIIDAVSENMTTNMTFDEMKSFISYGTSKDLQLDSLTLDGEDYQPANEYYYKLDEDSLKDIQKTLKKQLNLDNTEPHINEDILPYGDNGQEEEQPNANNGTDPNQEQPGPNQGEQNPNQQQPDPDQGEQNPNQEQPDPNGEADPDQGGGQQDPNDGADPNQGQGETDPNGGVQ